MTLFDNLSSIQEPVDWENQLFTPADAIILKPTKAHPKKKRKLQIDKSTTLSGEDIRNNLANPDSLVAAPVHLIILFFVIIHAVSIFKSAETLIFMY